MEEVSANSMACHPRATCHTAGCCHLANSMSWFQSYVWHCRVLPPGEFNDMSSQSHVSHCRVLPLGELTVTIPEPHATLQGAVTWRNQCHDRATLQGVKIPSAILKIVFAIFYFFVCFMQFRLWRAAAFVSSPIYFLNKCIGDDTKDAACWSPNRIWKTKKIRSVEHGYLFQNRNSMKSCFLKLHWNQAIRCLVMTKNDIQYRGNPPSWFFNISYLHGHVTVIEFQICRCVPNSIKIRWILAVRCYA